MMYIRQHGGERASTNPRRQGVLAPALYRLKWDELLAGHPERAVVAPAMRDGLMSVMIELAGRPEAREVMPRLEAAFRRWGGTQPYVTPPPRAVLRIGGLAALKALLGVSTGMRRNDEPTPSRFTLPATAGDREDAAVIAAATAS
jgi:hypothetical protein